MQISCICLLDCKYWYVPSIFHIAQVYRIADLRLLYANAEQHIDRMLIGMIMSVNEYVNELTCQTFIV